MGVIDLKALAKERGLRGHSRLNKAELIAFIQQHTRPPSIPTPLCNSPHGVVFTVGDFSIKSKIPWGSQKISWGSNCKNRGGVTFPRFENPQNQSRWVLT